MIIITHFFLNESKYMTSSLSFGTDGIRGRVGSFPFTEPDIASLAATLAAWAQKRYAKASPHFLIGHDTRESCSWISPLISNILQQSGCKTTYAGTIPTPAILASIQNDLSFDAGIVISASHNLYHDNGIKLFDARAGKISAHDEKEIGELFKAVTIASIPQLKIEKADTHYQNAYLKTILETIGTLSLAGKKIVIDCAHGAVGNLAPDLFRTLGATVIAINNDPTGKNINEHCGAVHPEGLRDMVITEKAWIGLAFDGDGDRLVMVNRDGIIKDGDDVLYLIAQDPMYKDTPSLIGTVMSNLGLALQLEKQGKKLLRASVGEKYVAQMLVEQDLILGGEPSGHTIVRSYLNAGDALFAAVAVLKACIATNNDRLESFVRTPQYLKSFRVASRQSLTESPMVDIIKNAEAQLTNGRILVRYSGTEPVLRVMVEDMDAAVAETTLHNLCSQLIEAFAK